MATRLDALRSTLSGRYEVDREIGRGGMAVVYLARDVRHGRMVAIKVLNPELAEALGTERFLREIKTAANLTHPHILPVHDSGSAGGELFYVMPFVEGQSLRDRLRREKQLPVAEAVRIVVDVAQALDYAHRHAVVHRDIKPENILLQGNHAFVVDFGIAGVIAEPPAGLTQTGVVLGTIAYMSPEQASGEPIDGRSDLYSLGCVLYEALAGDQPFSGPSAQAVLTRRFTTPAPRVRALRPSVPASIDEAIATALQVTPADRFRNAEDFAAALQTDHDRPIDAPQQRPRRSWMRAFRPRTVSLGVLAVLAIAAILNQARLTRNSTGRDNPPPPQQRTISTPALAVLPFVNISAEPATEYFSDGMTEELINALSRLQGLRVTSRTSAFTFKGTTANVREIAAKLGVGWVLEGSVRQSGNRLRITAQLIDARDDSHKWSETYERELKDVFAIQNEIAGSIMTALSIHFTRPGGEGLVSIPTRDLTAYQLYLQGRYFWNKRDEAGLLRSLDSFEKALAIDPQYALAHAGMADAYVILGGNGHRPPSDMFPKAKAAAERALALDGSLSQPHATLGLALTQYDWNFAGALREYGLAEQLNPSYATIPHWRAWTLAGPGRLEEALSNMRQAQSLDPLSLVINTQIGTMLHYLRRYEEADLTYRKALELDPRFPLAHAYLAANHARRGQFPSALAEARLASAQFGEVSAVRVLGPIQAAAGMRLEAERALKELATLSDRRYVSALDFATIHALLGNRDEAFIWLDRAVKTRASDLYLIGVDPMWDGLRDDARFRQVLRRLNLE